MNIRMPVLITAMLFLTGTAFAQDPEVNSANPATALQGAIGLNVDIAGANFEVGASVKFLVAGSKKTGGVTVTNVVVHDANNLTATIDVAADATVSNFDIEVRMSRGRGGKGTELFAVLLNENQGQGSNTSGIVTFVTNKLLPAGVYSDKMDMGNDTYVSSDLAGSPDCATVVVPYQDGVDNGKAQLFVRDTDGECAVSRKILVRGTGKDLNKDNETKDEELVDRKLMCFDTFDDYTTMNNVTCSLFIEQIDEDGRVDRHFRLDWNSAIAHYVSENVRLVTAETAEFYEFRSTKPNGRGKKEVIEHGTISMSLAVQFERVRH